MDLGKYGGISEGDPDRLDVGDEGNRAITDGAQVWGSGSWVYNGVIYWDVDNGEGQAGWWKEE